MNKDFKIKKLIFKNFLAPNVYRNFGKVVEKINAITKDQKYYLLEKIKEIIVDNEKH